MIEAILSNQSLPFYIIALALLFAFTSYKKLALITLIAALSAFLSSPLNLLDWTSVFSLALYSCLFLFINHANKAVFITTNTLIVIGSFLLATSLIPAIGGIMVKSNMQASPQSAWMNIEFFANKAFITILLLCSIKITPKPSSLLLFRKLLPVSILGILVILSLGLSSGIIKWDPYLHANTPIWLFDVLFLSVIGEEIFFRYYLQGFLLNRLAIKDSMIVLISAIFFAIAHVYAGLGMAVLAFIAGTLYAYLYQKSKNILWPIAIHMLLNLIHFSFFTYPTRFIN